MPLPLPLPLPMKPLEEAAAALQAAQDEADRLQGEVDTDAATKASDDAKELLNKALREPV